MTRRGIITALVHSLLWPVWFTLVIVIVTLMFKWTLFVIKWVW